VFRALETFVIIALYKSTFTIPYHTIPYHERAFGGGKIDDIIAMKRDQSIDVLCL